jgi:hypothetical protein
MSWSFYRGSEEDEQGAGGQPAITSFGEAESSVAGATAETFCNKNTNEQYL